MAEKPEKKKRDLLLSETITSSSVKDLIKEILEINFDDSEKEQIYKDWTRDPIRLFINTRGGSIYDGLALVDVIRQSKTPVYTVCIGSCMSMGLWIWLSGQKRIVGSNATLMFHDLSLCVIDKLEGVKQELGESLRLQGMFVNLITEKSTIKEEILKDYITRKAEMYISAKDAIENKLADEYLK